MTLEAVASAHPPTPSTCTSASSHCVGQSSGHAPGARHIPLSHLPARMKDLPPQRTVVTVCRSGHRSALAARMLAREGREVINLSGGMHAWARAGLPVVAAGGHRPGGVSR